MPNELQKHVTRKAEEITGRQWCSHCQMTRPKEGGEWKILEGGKRRRWKCQSCVIKPSYFGWCRYFDKPTSGEINGCFGFELRK
jgi:hypothetical protein